MHGPSAFFSGQEATNNLRPPIKRLVDIDNLKPLGSGSPFKVDVVGGFGKGRVFQPDLDIRDFGLRAIKADRVTRTDKWRVKPRYRKPGGALGVLPVGIVCPRGNRVLTRRHIAILPGQRVSRLIRVGLLGIRIAHAQPQFTTWLHCSALI